MWRGRASLSLLSLQRGTPGWSPAVPARSQGARVKLWDRYWVVKEGRAEWCLVCREGRRGVSRGGYQKVSSLGTIHHHQYLHKFSQVLTIGSTGLCREFGFLGKNYKSQTGREHAFSEHWFADVAEGRHQQEHLSSPWPHKTPSTHISQPVAIQSSLLHQFQVSVQPDMSRSESLAALRTLSSPSWSCCHQQQRKGNLSHSEHARTNLHHTEDRAALPWAT